MPLPTPFFERIAPLCRSSEWRNWSGYQCPVTYGYTHDSEYYALRDAAGLIDITPLYKYEIDGPDAERLLNRLVTRDVRRCPVGRMLYTGWCDDDGKLVDDGTLQRLGETRFRLTANMLNLHWLTEVGYGMTVDIRDISATTAALAVQGPRSREILAPLASGVALETLGFFHVAEGGIGDIPVAISRSGYTGDLGYELWTDETHAIDLWDRIVAAGAPAGLTPVGLAAMDIARVEAGLLLADTDYISARHAEKRAHTSSPFEAGLEWSVHADKPYYIGRTALEAERRKPAPWRRMGLEVDWVELEARFAEADLPPMVGNRVSRGAVPLYHKDRQIGQATSTTFSPLLKKLIALATLERELAAPGIIVEMELTVDFQRRTVPATVVQTPFFDPDRKRQ